MEPLKLSLQTICSITGESIPVVYDAINAGHLETFLVGRRRFARPAAVRAWVDFLEAQSKAGKPVAYRARKMQEVACSLLRVVQHSTADAIVQRDLRRACVHEYGHQEVARALGVYGHVRIQRNPEGGSEQYHFGGKFHFWPESASPRTLRMIGLAGSVAEELDQDAELSGWQFIDDIESGAVELTETDAAGAGAFTESDVDECIALVRRAWPAIEARVAIEMQGWLDEVGLAEVA